MKSQSRETDTYLDSDLDYLLLFNNLGEGYGYEQENFSKAAGITIKEAYEIFERLEKNNFIELEFETNGIDHFGLSQEGRKVLALSGRLDNLNSEALPPDTPN